LIKGAAKAGVEEYFDCVGDAALRARYVRHRRGVAIEWADEAFDRNICGGLVVNPAAKHFMHGHGLAVDSSAVGSGNLVAGQ
jgi:hypothetical protein